MEEEAPVLPLPDTFLDFLNESGIYPSIFTAAESTPHYIRLKPGLEEVVDEIGAELGCELSKVEWLPEFYSLLLNVQIASSKAYREGKIYGIDAALGAAFVALGIVEGDRGLDLCTAPGSVTGVDVASHRLAACRTMLQKYALGDRCRLFIADGTKFSVLPVRNWSQNEQGESTTEEDPNAFREWTSKRTYKDRKRSSRERKGAVVQQASGTREPELIFYGNAFREWTSKRSYKDRKRSSRERKGAVTQQASGTREPELIFYGNYSGIIGLNKVLVDAECTHDGSVKHILKFENWGWKTLQRRVLDAERTDNLTNLQVLLKSNLSKYVCSSDAVNEFSCLSLTVSQNEDVIKRFLMENASAELQDIEAAKNWPCKVGKIPVTLRFDPSTSQTSGLFVAKFKKLF